MARRIKTAFAVFLSLIITVSAGTSLSQASETNPSGSEQPILRLSVVGDIYLGGYAQPFAFKDPNYPFAGVLPVLEKSDIVVGNLEVPLSLKGAVWLKKKWTLRSDPRNVSALKAGHFHILTLANNHIMDYGPEALAETLQILDTNGILRAGAGMNLAEARRPAVIERKGVRVAVLAYNKTFPLEFNAGINRPGTAPGDAALVREDIQKARQLADIVVVAFHWSEELRREPKDYQIRFAHMCIDAGAQLVVGHHPHVLQGIEVYRNGLIAYSLGNFCFGTYSASIRDSVILQVELDSSGLRRAVLHPLNVDNREMAFQTRLRKGQDAVRALQELRQLSSAFGADIRILPDGTGEILILP